MQTVMQEAKSNVVIAPTFWHKDLSSLVEERNVCLFRKDKEKKAVERMGLSYTTVITKGHCFKLQ